MPEIHSNFPYVRFHGYFEAFKQPRSETVGAAEFADRFEFDASGSGQVREENVCWPAGYPQHYIRDGNVMPTRRFLAYVLARAAFVEAHADFEAASLALWDGHPRREEELARRTGIRIWSSK